MIAWLYLNFLDPKKVQKIAVERDGKLCTNLIENLIDIVLWFFLKTQAQNAYNSKIK